MIATVLGRDGDTTLVRGRDETGDELARRVVDVLESSRSTWQVWHVQAEALRQARYAGIPLTSLDETVGDVVERVTQGLSLPVDAADLGEPVASGADGVGLHHPGRTYTSAAILDAERRLLEAAERTGRYVIPEFSSTSPSVGTPRWPSTRPGQAGWSRALAEAGLASGGPGTCRERQDHLR